MQNPFKKYLKTLQVGEVSCQYYDIINCLSQQEESYVQKYLRLPYALRVILESLIRNCDGIEITPDHILSLIDWTEQKNSDSAGDGCKDIPFKPARVLLQDFTGVPAVVDFAAMRDIVKKLGGDPQKINPLCPVDLVVDHSIQVDSTKSLTNPLENLNVKSKQKGGRLDSANLHMLKCQQSDLSIKGSLYENHFVNNDVKLYENAPPLPPHTYLVLPNPNPLPLMYQTVPPPLFTPMVPPPFFNPAFLPPQPYAPMPIPSLISLPTTPAYINAQLHRDLPLNNNWQSSRYSNVNTTIEYLKQKSAHLKSVQNDDKSTVSIKELVNGNTESLAKISLCYGKEANKPSLKDINFNETPEKASCLICDAVPSTNFRRYSQCPFHQLVTDCSDALVKNQTMEFERNKERFEFLKWGAKSFKNMRIIPPGSGIVHQVNLEYLARVVFMSTQPDGTKLLHPDSVVGTDSHTTMINGLGVLGWGVGGIEAESVMLGQAITMEMPEVVGCHITGKLDPYATSTDLVLTVTKMLRQAGLVGKFVEFYGMGVEELSIADRATISNMCPEYGATLAFFPVDRVSLEYLLQSGRSALQVDYIEKYLQAVNMFRDYKSSTQDPIYSQVIEVDLCQVSTCVSGPKRPQDKVALRDVKSDFLSCLTHPAGFKGFGLGQNELGREVEVSERALQLDPDDDTYADAPNHGKVNGATNGDVARGQMDHLHPDPGRTLKLRHGSVVIAAITSCTNTSNPSVMLGAGLLAKKAVEAGLKVPLYVKTSLSPGSGVVTHYLKDSLTLPYLERLGFCIVGYGCMTCIGNSGPLHPALVRAIEGKDNKAKGGDADGAKQSPLVVCAVLSGNRNFEGRVHPHTRANYLASPLLVVAYALAGRVDIDFETEPLGYRTVGSGSMREPVYLRDVWPLRDEIKEAEKRFVLPQMFTQVYKSIEKGNENWQNLQAPEGVLYPWSPKSTYIKRPPFFDSMSRDAPVHPDQVRPLVQGARVLLWLGDSITTDHISPAGSIAKNSPAAKYLMDKGLTPRDFNSYGSRRGNDEVMVRGTFGNARLVNRLLALVGAPPSNHTLYFGDEAKSPSTPMPVYEACLLYQRQGRPVPLLVLAGKDYGSGSSRDWAAKGPYLLGVRAVIAESFERIHRSNLVGMGILPLQFMGGQSATSLKLVGDELFEIALKNDVAGPCALSPKQILNVKASNAQHTINFEVVMRIDTQIEIEYYENGGILNYMVRKML